MKPQIFDSPYRHAIVDNFLPEYFAERLYKEVRALNPDSTWYNYDSPFEKFKLATDKWENFPTAVSHFLMTTFTQPFIKQVEEALDIQGLFGDGALRGGGIHIVLPGGKLDVHADRQIHPQLDSYRRANVILYLNREWEAEWNGNLELWNENMSECEREIEPKYNRLVMFETTKTSFHGHPKELKCPPGFRRQSLAIYYWSTTLPEDTELNLGSTDFRARPNDEIDPEKEALRIRRTKGRLSTNVKT